MSEFWINDRHDVGVVDILPRVIAEARRLNAPDLRALDEVDAVGCGAGLPELPVLDEYTGWTFGHLNNSSPADSPLTVFAATSYDETVTWAQAQAHQLLASFNGTYAFGTSAGHYQANALRELSEVAALAPRRALSLVYELNPSNTQEYKWTANAAIEWVTSTLVWFQTSAQETTPAYQDELARIALAVVRVFSRGVHLHVAVSFMARALRTLRLPRSVVAGASSAAVSALNVLSSSLMRHAPPLPVVWVGP